MKVINRLSLLLFASLALVCCTKQDEGSGDSPKTPLNLKIMSFNIRGINSSDTGNKSWDQRKTAVQSLIKDKTPDVIGMQEATSQQRTDLKALLPEYALLEVPNTGTSKGGNTVLMYRSADFELLQCKSYYLSDTPEKPSVNGWNDETQYRTTIWAQFKHKTTNQVFFVFDTHMPLNKNTAAKGKIARDNSAELNVNRMKSIAGEQGIVFIVGDMNCTSADTGLQKYYDWPMNDGRKSAISTDSVNSFNNYGGSSSTLDYIFYRNVGAASKFETVNKSYNSIPYVSDHFPVMLTVALL